SDQYVELEENEFFRLLHLDAKTGFFGSLLGGPSRPLSALIQLGQEERWAIELKNDDRWIIAYTEKRQDASASWAIVCQDVQSLAGDYTDRQVRCFPLNLIFS